MSDARNPCTGVVAKYDMWRWLMNERWNLQNVAMTAMIATDGYWYETYMTQFCGGWEENWINFRISSELWNFYKLK